MSAFIDKHNALISLLTEAYPTCTVVATTTGIIYADNYDTTTESYKPVIGILLGLAESELRVRTYKEIDYSFVLSVHCPYEAGDIAGAKTASQNAYELLVQIMNEQDFQALDDPTPIDGLSMSNGIFTDGRMINIRYK